MSAASYKLVVRALAFALVPLIGAVPSSGADDAVLSGPAAAIAKARAAAQKADDRAGAVNEQSAKTLEAPAVAGETSAKPAPTQAEDGETGPAEAGEGADRTASYDPAAHRDPFVPMLLKGVTTARTPLETYQLGQLKLVGIVAQPDAGFRAMVEDSSGLGYIITTGTPIGSSGGVVRSIEPRRVVIEESTRDFYGDVKPKEVVMELPQEDRSP